MRKHLTEAKRGNGGRSWLAIPEQIGFNSKLHQPLDFQFVDDLLLMIGGVRVLVVIMILSVGSRKMRHTFLRPALAVDLLIAWTQLAYLYID